jgi:hypothetical protein
MCWYGDPKANEIRIPVAMGIFSLVNKIPVTETEKLHYDLIDKSYFSMGAHIIPYSYGKYRLEIIPLQFDHHYSLKWLRAFHGTTTSPGVLQSIIRDGILLPGTIASNGVLISPPPLHFPSDTTYNNIPNWAQAIFLTPFFGYAFNDVFAPSSTPHNEKYILECLVEPGSYTEYNRTVMGWENIPAPQWKKEPGEFVGNTAKPEWRIVDPRKVIVTAIIVAR